MVLLQDIPSELRRLANEKRNLESELLIISNAANRGQFQGTPAPVRCSQPRLALGEQDCIQHAAIQKLPPGGELVERVAEIDLEIEDLLQQQIESQTPELTETPDIVELTPQQPTPPQPQNNTLRNALIIGGAALLIL